MAGIDDLLGGSGLGELFADLPAEPDTLQVMGGMGAPEESPQLPPKLQKQNMAMFDGPLPGASWTAEPGSQPYERPPEYVDEDKAADFLFQRFMDEDNYRDLMRVMDAGMPVPMIAQHVLMYGGAEGKWNTDMILLLAPTVMAMLGTMAHNAGIEPVMEMPKRKTKGINPEPVRQVFKQVQEIAEKDKDKSTQEIALEEEKVEVLANSLLGTPPPSTDMGETNGV